MYRISIITITVFLVISVIISESCTPSTQQNFEHCSRFYRDTGIYYINCLQDSLECTKDDGYYISGYEAIDNFQIVSFFGHKDCTLGKVPILFDYSGGISSSNIKKDTLFERGQPMQIKKWTKDSIIVGQFGNNNIEYVLKSTFVAEDKNEILVWDNEPFSDHYINNW